MESTPFSLAMNSQVTPTSHLSLYVNVIHLRVLFFKRLNNVHHSSAATWSETGNMVGNVVASMESD
jgi:hypothetical protein